MHAMGPEQESKLTDSAVTRAGSTIYSLKGSTRSKLGDFQVSAKGSTSLRARQHSYSLQLGALGSYLLCL